MEQAEPLKQFKGTIEYEINFTEKGVEFIYSPQNDETNLLALFVAEQCATRAKENLTDYCNQNRDKKAEDRLNWMARTIKGLQIQQDAFMEMLYHSGAGIDQIKQERTEIATSIINEMEAKIQSGDTSGMTIVTKQDIPTEE